LRNPPGRRPVARTVFDNPGVYSEHPVVINRNSAIFLAPATPTRRASPGSGLEGARKGSAKKMKKNKHLLKKKKEYRS
jgi:hypothetical protein